ncbi:MAG: hypothetical protein OK422_03160 [Thaumarchaeota archaeon]|nr:hypothetical protein [Nitrososphaerota archaeon]
MPESVIEGLRRQLDLEEQSERLAYVPSDLYSRVAAYMQSLRRTANSNNSEITNRLIVRQNEMISGMVEMLLNARLRKANSKGTIQQLLPEERHICSAKDLFESRKTAFLQAVASGQSSILGIAYKAEMGKSITVRFLKPVTEIMGFDLKRYGPFKPQDLALVPSANVDVLVANGEAVIVQTTDEF